MNPIEAKKSLGQHFLRDRNIIRKIAGSLPVAEGDRLLEIGPGTGMLTEELLSRFGNVTAVEIDRRAVELLRREYPALEVIHQDILRFSWEDLVKGEGELHVVGNLPYYITSPILFSILGQRKSVKSATLMVQKEVAERLVALPRTKEYGILSVQVQLMSSPSLLFDVSRGAFSPPPAVNSTVVQLLFDRPELSCTDHGLKRVVRLAFQQRRKKLSNALKSLGVLPEDPEFDYDKRAEAWEPALYEKLTARLEQDGTLT